MGHLLFLIGITTLWFLPGILLRGYQERKFQEAKADAQAKAIARLYPKKKEKDSVLGQERIESNI